MHTLTEKDLLASIRAALAIHAVSDVLEAVTQLAALYIQNGMTQEGADVLYYVLAHDDTAADTRETARTLLEELETWICPRVLLDAQDFAAKAHFDDVIEYVFA